jgi:hypothetical protein
MSSLILSLQDRLAVSLHNAQSDAGFIYGVKNECLPGLVKIGMTRSTVAKRIGGMLTAYPKEWVVISSVRVRHVALVERTLHEFFGKFRVNQGREFFQLEDCQIEETFRICDEVDGESGLADQQDDLVSDLAEKNALITRLESELALERAINNGHTKSIRSLEQRLKQFEQMEANGRD